MRRPKFHVRVRSFTAPCRIFNRGGWKNSVKYTPWVTLASFTSYDEAKRNAAEQPLIGLRVYAVFYRGKPYRESRNAAGELLKILVGEDALRGDWR